MKKMMAMVATIAMAMTMVGCGQAIPATTVSTQKLEAPMTENVIVENTIEETIVEETIEEEETKRVLNGVLRFVNDKGAVMFYMAMYDDEYFTIDKSLDDLVETLNEECAETYIRMEEDDKYVIKSIDEKKNVTSIWMVTVRGDENDF